MIKIIIIAAHDPNLVIGNEGKLPWHYSEDLKHFKSITTGHPIVMGRGVFEELGEKPLPNRQNIVLSTTRNYDNVACYTSMEQALEAIEREGSSVVYIIGGGVVYEQILHRADELIITLIHKEFKGNTFFPEYRDQIGIRWEETERTDVDHLSFISYKRIETN